MHSSPRRFSPYRVHRGGVSRLPRAVLGPVAEQGHVALGRVDHHFGNPRVQRCELAYRDRLPPFGQAVEIVGDRRRKIELRSEEHTSELQSLMRISYAVFCLKKKTKQQ